MYIYIYIYIYIWCNMGRNNPPNANIFDAVDAVDVKTLLR